jgi:hypothetical protein
MHSAFGVDHGDEISKVGRPRLTWPKRAPRTNAAQKRTATPPGSSATGPQKVKGAFKRATETPISLGGIGRGTGQTFQGVGGFLEKRPGLTGTALVGGGGALGYRQLSRREPRKKKP